MEFGSHQASDVFSSFLGGMEEYLEQLLSSDLLDILAQALAVCVFPVGLARFHCVCRSTGSAKSKPKCI